MDLKSGYPFWAIKNGLMCTFPQLKADISCDVVLVGGGITGALIADELGNNGFDVVVVEQRDIGWGSSAASTALLQYEIDTHMVDLAKMYGEVHAVLAYRACADAITDLRDLANELDDVDFDMQESLYYASKHRDKAALREEYELRVKHDFDAHWLDSGSLKESFGIKAPCGIRVAKMAEAIGGEESQQLCIHYQPYRKVRPGPFGIYHGLGISETLSIYAYDRRWQAVGRWG